MSFLQAPSSSHVEDGLSSEGDARALAVAQERNEDEAKENILEACLHPHPG